MDVDPHGVSDAAAGVTGFVDLIFLGGPSHAYSPRSPRARADVAGSLLPGELNPARRWEHDLAEDMRSRDDGRAPSQRP